ncbi:sulfotransferase [Fulvivirga maritima]|uniref:sulfotransferase family protein n=1 Tax=Fulvivirga maritima TaxID=2904247 RepID=UPI001F2DC334|nr:sulfotransferase [Fulvivirga maritima]UII27792.1 sulfotransferase [Fulvivirga maritima]
MKVLVVGCERSGTSAISNLLARATKKNILDDPEYTWYLYPIIFLQKFTFSLRLFVDINKYYIVKVPGFATILPYLRYISLFKFRVIYVIRDPRDNVASILERLEYDFNGLFLNVAWLRCSPRNIVETLSYRWNKYLQLCLEYKSQHPDEVKIIRYEDFLNDKGSVLKGIADFCELKFDINEIENELDIQYRKRWSSKITGQARYKVDLNPESIKIIERVNEDFIKSFNYNE